MKNVLLFIAVCAYTLISACAMQPDQGSKQETANKDSAIAHAELAQGYYAQNQFGIALDEFNKAIKIHPGFAEAYNGLGLVYSALGESAKAELNFKKSLELNPNSSEAKNNYGSFLCSIKRYDESINYFLEAVKNPLYPSPDAAFINAGICSLAKKDVKNAKTYFEEAYRIQPLAHRAAYELARLSYESGDAAKAKSYLQNTILVAPSAPVLWLGLRIERALGNKDSQASYELELKKKYPDSPETKALLSGI